MPVAVADDGCALSGTIAHRVWEFYLLQECLYLLVESCTADDDLVELAAEGLDDLLAYPLADFLRDDGHGQKQSHAVVLYLGKHLLADNLLNDQRHGDDNLGLHIGKGLCDDGRRGYPVQVVGVASVQKLENELEGHAVHVSHGQYADNAVAGFDNLAQHMLGKVIVRPDGTIGYHHTLRESRGAAGVVNECQLVTILFRVIVDVFLAEELGKLLAIEFVQVLAGIGQFVRARHHQRVVGVVDDALQVRHLYGVYLGGHVVTDKQQFGVRVIHDVVYLVCHELMQDGHGNGSIGQRGQECHSPLTGVSSTKGYLVTFLHTTVLKQYMQFLYLACHVVILQRRPLIVCQRIQIPVVNDALLYQLVKTWVVFHNTLFI